MPRILRRIDWRRGIRRTASALMLFVVLFAIVRAHTSSLVCSYTNEVLATCCCANEAADESSGPAIDRTCCCRTMLAGQLPQSTATDTDDTVFVAPAGEIVALAQPIIVPPRPSIPTRLAPRETGPPPSAPHRLARLQVFHL